MAELATIARPYAEALMKASSDGGAQALAREIGALGRVAADPALQSLAVNPKVQPSQVLDLIGSVVGAPLGERAANLLRTVIDNGRLAALPEVARQFQALVDAETGIAQATIQSAFPIGEADLAELRSTMEKRFGRRLETTVVVDPSLIGGVRVVVGDEVLDTSIRARLAQMKAALVA